MGELLTVLFIGTVILVSGLVLVFSNDNRGRKYGMYMIVVGLLVYFACWLFTPNTDNYRLYNKSVYER